MDISKGQTAKLLFPVLLLIKSVIFSEHCVDDVIVQYNLKRIIAVWSAGHLEDNRFIVCQAFHPFNRLKNCIEISLVGNARNFDELDILTICAFKRDDGVIVCCEVCRI